TENLDVPGGIMLDGKRTLPGITFGEVAPFLPMAHPSWVKRFCPIPVLQTWTDEVGSRVKNVAVVSRPVEQKLGIVCRAHRASYVGHSPIIVGILQRFTDRLRLFV